MIPIIVEALAKIAKSLPGNPCATNLNMHGCEQSAIEEFVAAGGRRIHYTSEDGTREWDSAEIDVDGFTLVAYGPHRKVAQPAEVLA